MLSYARRILSLVDEARDVLTRPVQDERCGSAFRRISPPIGLRNCLQAAPARGRGLRLDVRADQSLYLRRDLERGDLDLVLLKRDAAKRAVSPFGRSASIG